MQVNLICLTVVAQAAVVVSRFNQQQGQSLISFGRPDLQHGDAGGNALATFGDGGKAVVSRTQISRVELKLGQTRQKHRVCQEATLTRQFFNLVQRVLRMFRAAGEEPLKTQQRLGDRPALVQLTHKAGQRNAHIVEKDLAKFTLSRQILDRSNRYPGCLQINQQKADAGLLLDGFVGAHQHEYVGAV